MRTPLLAIRAARRRQALQLLLVGLAAAAAPLAIGAAMVAWMIFLGPVGLG